MHNPPDAMASDDRGLATQETANHSQQVQVPTYASTTARKNRPTKEQAVIIEAIEGYTNDDYIDGLEKLVNPSDIRFISKITGGRVCVFLSNTELVTKLSNQKVIVKDSYLNILPYIEKNKRVVISNVNPTIPDEILLNALKSKGISPVSNIYDIKASLSKPGRAHILSFRRQVYIKEQDETLLPESMQISYDNTSYWIFLSTDSTRCFICKQSGHVAKMCPNSQESTAEGMSQVNNSINNNFPTELNTQNLPENTLPLKLLKRPPPPSTTSTSSQKTENIEKTPITPTAPTKTTDSDFKKPSRKKFRKNAIDAENTLVETDEPDLTRLLQKARISIQETGNKYVINFDQLQNFLEESYGQNDILQISQKFSNDTEGIITLMDDIYKHLESRKLKARFTRMKKKLRSPTSNTNNIDSDSQSSDNISTC